MGNAWGGQGRTQQQLASPPRARRPDPARASTLAHWPAAGSKKPSARYRARAHTLLKGKKSPSRGARGNLDWSWPANTHRCPSPPLRSTGRLALYCPRLSPGTRPQRKYLAPSGEGGRGSAERKKEADRAGKKGKKPPRGVRSVAAGLESAEDSPLPLTPLGAAEVL